MNTIEKPIIFSTPMIQAIYRDDKTKTRRIERTQPHPDLRERTKDEPKPKLMLLFEEKPLYTPGTLLWVRETWCNINKPGIPPEYYYFADTKDAEDYDPSEWKWRPSIHMPRAAARLFLRVEECHMERLLEITEEDAIAEGFMATREKTTRECFLDFWDVLNEKRGYSAQSNPWIWAVAFHREERSVNQ